MERFRIVALLALSACTATNIDELLGSKDTSSSTGSGLGLQISSGNQQSSSPLTNFQSPLRVVLTDASGPLVDYDVQFTVTDGAGTLSPTSARTDSFGIAQVLFTSGDTPGKVKVEAASLGQKVIFDLTVKDYTPTIKLVGGNYQSASVSTALGQPLRVQAVKGSTPLAGVPVVFNVDSGTGSLSASLVTTDVNGFAETSFTTGATPGAAKVTALGLGQTVAFDVNVTASAPALTLVGGNSQSVAPGSTFSTPLRVRVAQAGVGVNNQTVSFSIRSGNGTLGSSTATTDVNGFAQVTLTAGPSPGALQVQVDAVGQSVFFDETITSFVPQLTIIGGNFQTAAPASTFPQPLKVLYAQGPTPLVNQTITFTQSNGPAGGSFTQTSVVTDSSGMAQTVFTPGPTAGSITVTATAAGGVLADFTLTTIDQSGNQIAALSGSGQSGNVGAVLASPLVARVTKTADSSPSANIMVEFTVQSGNARLNGTQSAVTVSTDGSGNASVSVTAGTQSGASTIRAQILSTPAQQVTFTVTSIVPANSTVDLAQSVVTLSPTGIQANGIATSVATVTLKDNYGNTIPDGGGKTVVFSTNAGTFTGSVSTTGNGLYSRTIQAPTSRGVGYALISATVNGQALTSSAAQLFLNSGPLSLSQSSVSVSSGSITANGVSTTTITVTLRDALGNQLSSGGDTVVISTNKGTLIGTVQDNGNGTYQQVLQSGTVAGAVTLGVTVGAQPITSTMPSLTFTPGTADPTKSYLVATPGSIPANGSSTAQIMLVLRDSNNNPLNSGGATVTISSTAGTFTTSVSDNGDGTYSRTLQAASSPVIATLSATVGGSAIGSTKSFSMTAVGAGPSPVYSLVGVVGASTLPADGTTTTTVKVTLKNAQNQQLSSGGNSVIISATAGTLLGSVVDNGDGTYTQVLRAPSSAAANVTLSATVDSVALNTSATMSFYGAFSLAQSTLTASPAGIQANGTSTTTLVLTLKDSQGTPIPVGGQAGLSLSTTSGTLVGSLQDNSNGTYTQALRSINSGTLVTATVSALSGATPFSSQASVNFFVATNLAGLTIDCLNIATYKNKPVLVDGGTLTMNTYGPNGNCPSEFVFTDVVVQNSGIISHTAIGTSGNEYGLEFTAQSLSVASGSRVHADAKGYGSNQNYFIVPYNQVSSASVGGGGSYGGGGSNLTGATSVSGYGSLFEPNLAGASGGQWSGQAAGVGGGRLHLTITGTLQLDGQITSSGSAGTGNGGSGAGGSIWLTVGQLSGAGIVRADGGAASCCTGDGAGGGRVAIYYTGLSGSFAYPVAIGNAVRAKGGIRGDNAAGAAAGTVYLKGASQTYGDLIIDNKGTYTLVSTVIKSPGPVLVSSVSSASVTKSGAFLDNFSLPNPYKNWYLDPNVNQNATPTKLDNTLCKITGGDANTLITTGCDLTTLVGNTAVDAVEPVLVFDNVDIKGGAVVTGNARIVSLNGDLSSNDVTTASVSGTIPAGMEYPGASLTIDMTGLSASLSQPALTVTDYSNKDTVFKGGAFSIASTWKGRSFTLNAATLTSQIVSGTRGLDLTGDLQLLSASKINHLVASTTEFGPEYSVDIKAANLSICSTCSIDVSGKGYPVGTNGSTQLFRYLGNRSTKDLTNVLSTGGASHGGRGGQDWGWQGFPDKTYDSIMNPHFAGSSSTEYNGSANDSAGGGVVRIDVSGGVAQIDGAIKANGQESYYQAAGGSIYLVTNSLQGVGSIQAKGGNATNGVSAGGGGRIAIYYTSLAGSFVYPSGVMANVQAFGGVSSTGTTRNGAAGTVYLKSSTQTYGDLIIANNGTVSTGNYVTTPIGYAGGASTSVTVSGNTLSAGSNLFYEDSYQTGYLEGYYLDPNTSQNATSTWTDDTLFKITSHTGNSLTVSGNLNTVASNGNPFNVLLVLDHLEVRDGAVAELLGPVLVTHGDISSGGGSFTLNNASIVNANKLELASLQNLTISSALTALNLGSPSLNGNLSLTGGTITAGSLTAGGTVSLSGTKLTLNKLTAGGNLVIDNTSTLAAGIVGTSSSAAGGNVVPNVIVTGDVNITNSSKVTSIATTGTAEYYLYITAANVSIDASSSVNVESQGYPPLTAYRFRTIGNTDATGKTGGAGAGGGSHGGEGGGSVPMQTYGSFKAPVFLGSSGTNSNYIQTGTGGGAVRMDVGTTLTNNGTISASAVSVGLIDGGGGAGGSIYINTQNLAGTGSMTAHGGNSTSNGSGGGGGRIALYYTAGSGNYASNASIANSVKAYGGTGGSATYSGAAGTVFFKAASETYGNLMIDNTARVATLNNAKTVIPNATSAVLSAVSSTTATSSNAFVNQFGNMANFLTGLFVNPRIAQNATATSTDDTIFGIASNTASVLTVTSGSLTSVASAGDSFRLVLALNNLDVIGKAVLDFGVTNDIRVLSGDISSGNNDFSLDGTIYAHTLDMGSGIFSMTANGVQTNMTYRCAGSAGTGGATLNCP